MESFWSAFLGGGMALAGVFLQGILQENHQKELSRKEELGLIASIRCELAVLVEIFESKQDEIQKGDLGPDGYFQYIFPITGNYLAYFDANYQHFHKITNEAIRLEIQSGVAFIRSYIDSVIYHNKSVEDYIVSAENFVMEESNKVFAFKHKVRLEGLQTYDKDLVKQAKHLESTIRNLIQEMDNYRPANR